MILLLVLVIYDCVTNHVKIEIYFYRNVLKCLLFTYYEAELSIESQMQSRSSDGGSAQLRFSSKQGHVVVDRVSVPSAIEAVALLRAAREREETLASSV